MLGYPRMLAELFARRAGGMRFGLERVREALEALGRPQDAFDVVHIAGTNGKGSVAAMVDAILVEAGIRTGLYTSPHLCRFTERYRIGGAEVEREILAPHLERALAMPLSFFEVATVAAFTLLAEQGVRIAVLETGLGGRLDATNVVERPLCTVVTSVALDYQALLGATLGEIAAEKAAICKPGRPAVLSARDPAVLATLGEHAQRLGATPILLDLLPYRGELPLGGAHQRENAALAVAAARFALPTLDDATIARGLLRTRWPGRLERVGDWLLDVAHNPEGAQALARALAGEPPRVLIFGVASDKDAAGMLAALAPTVEQVILTRGAGDRFADPAALLAAFPRASVQPDLASAIAKAGGRGVIAGSCYLVGEARALLLGEPMDEIALSDPGGVAR